MIEKIHHIGIAVRDLDEALKFYRDTLGLHVHAQDTIEDQGVKAALLNIGESEIELLEPTRPDSAVGRFLERKGEGLHHICFQTPDVDGGHRHRAGVQVDRVGGMPGQSRCRDRFEHRGRCRGRAWAGRRLRGGACGAEERRHQQGRHGPHLGDPPAQRFPSRESGTVPAFGA